jgi:isoleucyl-tRNA synthetase
MPFVTEHVYQNLVRAVAPEAPASIHLLRFPHSDPALRQTALEADMEAARRVLRAGLAARNAAKLKVRQPLGRMLLAAPPPVVRAVQAFEPEVLDELNVERLEMVASLADRVAVSVELDPRDASALPPNSVPALRAALAARPGQAVLESLLATGQVTLPVADRTVTLGWADIKLRAEGRDGFAAAVDRDVSVALETTLTADLRRKALARHLVHHVQMMRKEARLNADDRIRIAVSAHGEVAETLAEHQAYICAETLAVELRWEPAPAGWIAREVDLETARATLAVTPVELPPAIRHSPS